MPDAPRDGPASGAGGGRRLEIGRIGRPHGLRGEVAVTLTTNRPERLAPGSVLFAGERQLVVVGARPHQRRWLVQFEGVEDRSAAEALRGAVLGAEPLGDLEPGELWVHELVGCTVTDRAGEPLGRVVAVEANPAHDLLVLDGGALVPMVFVVDHHPGVVVVDIPEGLLEINAPR
ncbi:MAG: ribosome maturation factor RimM [Acidimicrobiia bacterium]|nr:ribosome maturation factor RimM [Acidimicrobiia bacterium]